MSESAGEEYDSEVIDYEKLLSKGLHQKFNVG
jgi:hypothetical protein